MAFVLGVLCGSVFTTETAAASCEGELLDLIDPVITVVDGPGDPVAEAALWSTFEYIQVVAPNEFHIDGTTADLEGSP